MFKKQQGIEYIDLKSKSGQQRKFYKVKYLGSGGFARCYEIYEQANNTKQHYAFKIIKKSTLYQTKQLIERLRTQIKLHKKFSEPRETANQHIVRFIESFQTQDYIYLLLELCVNQTLNELIRRRKFLTEEETRFYIWQLANGLKEIHSRNVVHRDIKLCNLFLAQGLKIKIGDFGLAADIQENRKRYTVCGTANYIAPEMIRKDHTGAPIGHGYEVDVWALGVVCYTIFFGKYPFEAQQEQSIYNKVLSCKYSLNPYSMKQIKQLNINGLNHFPSDELKSFIKGIFQVDPSKRLTLDEILAHRFLNKTSVPQELPQISLKCTLKKDTIEKLFAKRQYTEKPKSLKDYQVKQKPSNQSFNQSSLTPTLKNPQTIPNLNSELSEKLLHSQKTQIQIHNTALKKTQSYENQQEKTQNFQDCSCQKLVQQFNQIEFKNTDRNESIFIRFERKSRPQNELCLNNLKSKSVSMILEIILQSGPMQRCGYEKAMLNGMMIKVFKLSDSQEISLEGPQSDYTIVIHPKLNYLIKVIDSWTSNGMSRKPLGEVPEGPKNKQQLNNRENAIKERFVVKIPLKKMSHKGLKEDKDQNSYYSKYWEQLNIVKAAYSYLAKMEDKRVNEGIHWRGNQVAVN